MPYYDKISKQWHSVTGFHGGAFKSLVLNEILLDKIGSVEGIDILELGAGNGYFFPMILKRYSGQQPKRIFITDVSEPQLRVAQKYFRIHQAEYQKLNIYKPFPFPEASVDLILSTMVFNELKDYGVSNGVRESHRVLKKGGRMLITILHPEFVQRQIDRGVIIRSKMKSADGLLLPVINRPAEEYLREFEAVKFSVELESVYGNDKLYKEKPALKKVKDLPIGLIFTLKKEIG
jgi:SAM-dependent methyltransferase